MTGRDLTPRQSHVMEELLRYATVQREAMVKVDELIREAVTLGVRQTAVALVAGVSQSHVSRLVSPPDRPDTPRRRRSRRTAGAPGGTV